MTVKTDFGTYEVYLRLYENADKRRIAHIQLYEMDGQPFATIAKQLYESVDAPMLYVDTNNCPWAEKFIEDNQLGEYTGISTRSGYCMYPLYAFNLGKLRSISR